MVAELGAVERVRVKRDGVQWSKRKLCRGGG
jgi:hypothetical protein